VQELMNLAHYHPVGCISDMVQNKKDITLKLRTADICPVCQKIICEKKVPFGLVNQVLNTMESIRSRMLFRERFKYHLQPSRIVFNLLQRKVIMQDIQNLTIHLTPLEATVYYLFLKYPGGLLLNRLDEYEDEMYQIYGKCSVANGDNNIAAMRNRIRTLVDPLKNSLNEKLSRIRRRFIADLGKELAQHYVIHRDESDGVYKIDIDRALVKLVDE